MRGFLVDPFLKNISEVDVDFEKDGLDAIYRLIDCSTFDVAFFNDLPGHALHVDDDSPLKSTNLKFFKIRSGFSFFGKALLLGLLENGDSCDVSVTLAEFKKAIVF